MVYSNDRCSRYLQCKEPFVSKPEIINTTLGRSNSSQFSLAVPPGVIGFVYESS